MDWMCPYCGSRTYHYDRARIQNRCNGCGRPVDDRQQMEQQLQYDRTLANARNHLSAGNWAQAISLLNPLLNQRPTDYRLYSAILSAATMNYADYETKDTGMRDWGYYAWDKLERFNRLDDRMRRYGEKRYDLYVSKLTATRNRIHLYLALAVTALWGWVAVMSDRSEGMVFAVFWGLVWCVVKVCKSHPFRISKALREAKNNPSRNPFSWRFDQEKAE